jgi:hypothetical protein
LNWGTYLIVNFVLIAFIGMLYIEKSIAIMANYSKKGSSFRMMVKLSNNKKTAKLASTLT